MENNDISILEVADKLGIKINHKKAMCFTGHDKKSPSLHFTPEKNLWYCFGCRKGGKTINLVMEVNNMSYIQSKAWLFNNFNNYPNKYKIKTALTKIKSLVNTRQIMIKDNIFKPDIELYDWFINKCKLSANAREYLYSRGFNDQSIESFRIKEIINSKFAYQETIKKWGLDRALRSGIIKKYEKNDSKWYSIVWWDHAILFPFIEEDKTQYIQGRRLAGNGPKYLGLIGVEKPLYNKAILKKLNTGDLVYICEGIPDTIMANQHSLNSVGILGAGSFKEEWVDLFLDFDIVIIPDNDKVGYQSAKAIAKLFSLQGKMPRIANIPSGKDLNDYFLNIKKKGRQST